MIAGAALPRDVFVAIRREMELVHCKWDAQVGDVTTLADFPIMLTAGEWGTLARDAEALAAETIAIERELFARPALHARLGMPRALRRVFRHARRPTPAAARVMRFDFHRTTEGWRISEVNSDVPGGYTEASAFTALVASAVGARPTGDPAAALVASIARTVGEGGEVALMNAPGHMEDHQVVAYLAQRLRAVGLRAHVIAPSQLTRADAIVRFYQAEWLARLPRTHGWERLFVDGETPVVNPGIAALSESKRLALVWSELATAAPAWRRLLPETRAPGWRVRSDWLLKTAYCNTGDTVSHRAWLSGAEWRRRLWSARIWPRAWAMQRRFEEVPVAHRGLQLDACIGVYTVDGVAAGAYGRVVPHGSIIDAYARDVAVLIDG